MNKLKLDEKEEEHRTKPTPEPNRTGIKPDQNEAKPESNRARIKPN